MPIIFAHNHPPRVWQVQDVLHCAGLPSKFQPPAPGGRCYRLAVRRRHAARAAAIIREKIDTCEECRP